MERAISHHAVCFTGHPELCALDRCPLHRTAQPWWSSFTVAGITPRDVPPTGTFSTAGATMDFASPTVPGALGGADGAADEPDAGSACADASAAFTAATGVVVVGGRDAMNACPALQDGAVTSDSSEGS